ncbi:uncharacterized protein LOC127756711 [Oryza glaberrima]|uniref:uncharacterized protein LOC127756711 n=1 Tax=Oryza glaberrima TaxID=4538 RepID=UPI00224BF104|nr:uncharacterized protein LOC127756711 [Oryza glaberrima]XP_052138044.1 uncharacterized protein LOC127756711 [Oryza glaberrima]
MSPKWISIPTTASSSIPRSWRVAEGIVIVWLSVPRTGGRGHCDRVVVGAEDIYFVPETEQQADGVFVPDSELHPNGCFVPNSDESEQANGGVVDSELHPDSGFVPDSEEQGSGGVLDSELLADGGFVADSKKQAVGGVPNLEEQHLDGIEELVDGEVALVQDDAHAAADDARLTNLLKLAKIGMMGNNTFIFLDLLGLFLLLMDFTIFLALGMVP